MEIELWREMHHDCCGGEGVTVMENGERQTSAQGSANGK